MHSYNDKSLLFSLLFIGLVASLAGHWIEAKHLAFTENGNLNQAAAILATQQNLVSKTPVLPTFTLGFAGDIMLDRGVKKKVVTNLGGDYAKIFAHADFLKTPDIMFANLEGPVSDQGKDRHNLYSFRMDPKVIPALHDAGIDVVSFANNHVGDYGLQALSDTVRRLHDGGILACGAGMTKAEAEEPAVISQDGYSVGFLCFSDVGPDDMAATETTPGILLASDPDFADIVKNASQKVNALIVSFHFGVEYQTTHNARQEELAKRAVDNGAIMVVGSHPHVAEDMTTYNGAPILYSLGNFVFDQPFSKNTMKGLYVTATLAGHTVSDLATHETALDSNFAVSLK